MWSVVEKTALAEAEVEYQDYTATGLGEISVTCSAAPARHEPTLEQTYKCLSSDLDHDSWTMPGRPSDQFLAENQIRPLRGDATPRRQLGEARRPLFVIAFGEPGPRSDRAGARQGLREDRGVCPIDDSLPTRLRTCRPAGMGGNHDRRAAPPRRSRHRRYRHRLRSHRAGGMAAKSSKSGRQCAGRAGERGHQYRDPLHRR